MKVYNNDLQWDVSGCISHAMHSSMDFMGFERLRWETDVPSKNVEALA